ncbi:sodium-coupled monocarboxylate transporter 1-like [Diaphorina citri]|uniref:Sodium-coupled monocarboxylate transporter 1-like n=1 Tax=Diaphorina citri TaxID=121845 RepID=A0A3Q0IMG3_DIACI|nr:sodium-coupled monocarboxylate transporter 1-like [Diaphorina citri]
MSHDKFVVVINCWEWSISLSPDPTTRHSWFTLIIGGIFTYCSLYGINQMQVQRYLTMKDYKTAPLYSYSTNRTISDRRGGQLSKVLTFIYGLVCLCIAYLAKYLGSVLQASLTIFGVVGGPVLGVFTLGMTVTFANQQGALAGIVSGLLFCSLVGFGGPKPAPKKLPSTIEGCPNLVPSLSSILRLDNSVDNNFIDEDATTIRYTDMSSSQDQYFYLYRISYMYYIVLGFCVTMLVGAIVSRFFDTPSYDVNLLTPWVAARARRKHNGPYKEPELSPETVHMKNNNEQKGCDNEFSCDTTVSTQFKLN